MLQAHDPSNRAARGSLTQAIVYVLTFTFPAVIQVTTFLRKTRVGKNLFYGSNVKCGNVSVKSDILCSLTSAHVGCRIHIGPEHRRMNS